jgi:hypothetical protein
MFARRRRRRVSRSRAGYEGKVLYEFERIPVVDAPRARAPTGGYAALWSLLSVAFRRRFGPAPLHQS